MKYLFRLSQTALILLLFLPLLSGQTAPNNWFKFYGDEADNFSEEAKLYGGSVYVAGRAIIPGPIFGDPISYGTFSKMEAGTGQVIWEVRLDFQSRIEDFVFVPEDNTFLLVGHITPFQNDVDNSSFIAKIDDQGDVVSINLFDNIGRESFTRIIRHPEPLDVMAPYYVLGRINPEDNAPSFVDVPVVLNIDAGGLVNWRRELSAFGRELETVRGISVAADGDLLVVGNDIPENNGVVIKIRRDGALDEAWAHPGSINWYDATPLGDGNTLIVGERFAAETGTIGLMNETTGEISNGFQFPEVTEIVRTGALTFPDTDLVAIYFTGRVNDFQLRTNVIGVTIYDPAQGTLSSPNFFRPNSTNVQGVEAGKVFADNVNKQVVYTDTRETFSDGFIGIGKKDITVGVFPPGLFDANCMNTIDLVSAPFTVDAQAIEVDVMEGSTEESSGIIPTLVIDYECLFMCEPLATCQLSLSATVEPVDDCFEVNLVATPEGGDGPYTVVWEINCDLVMSEVITTEFLTIPYTFAPAQDYTVCVKITDAEGCTDSLMIEGVLDIEDPVITGCTDVQVILSTDPGVCTAVFDANDYISATDNCSGMLVIQSFVSSSRSSGIVNNPLVLDLGETNVLIDVLDEAENLEQCTINVLVVDQEAPSCPTPPVVQATANPCGEPVVVSFPDPVFTDNCPGDITVNPTSMPSSGDVFPIGTTPITFSGTDAAGNVGNCTVTVVVSESCGEVVSSNLNCRGDGNYQLVIDFDNGLPLPVNACTYSVMVDETFVDLTGPIQFANDRLVIDVFTGELYLEATATVQLVSNCPCPDDMLTNCSFTFEATVECCLELRVPDTVICADLTTLEIPILGLDQLVSPYDIQQVRYYVSSPLNCSIGGDAFQITNGYQPLLLAPNFHDGNICVYAEVDLAGGGACSTIRTEIARVQKCDPVSGTILNQQFCYSGDPVLPAPLELTLHGGDPDLCGADIQWFGPDGNVITDATDLTYQPDMLSLPAGSLACDERFTYRAVITSICGTISTTAVIRLFNEDAPDGTLTIDAPDVPPLCPGEDAVIRYDQACTGDEMMWAWWERNATTPYSGLATNGTQNPVYFTNRLYEDTWYLVTKKNGSCPADSLEIFVDITDPLVINSFTADYNIACQPEFLALDVTFSSQPDCVDSVVYYRNGLLLAVQPAAMAAYDFTPADGNISGNYYAIVRDTCCNTLAQTEVMTVENPPGIAIGGPCFLCNSDENDMASTLTALPTGIDLADVNLEWFVDGTPIGGLNVSTLEIFDDTGDVYTLEMTTANGCVYTASFTPYKRCFVVGVNDILRVQGRVFPNPATDQLTIQTDQPVRFREITFYDALGRPVKTIAVTGSVVRVTISLDGLPKGLYILQAFTDSGALLAREVVKE